jgi:hypothetical protein
MEITRRPYCGYGGRLSNWFLLVKQNGEEVVGRLSELTLKDIIQLCDTYGVKGII